MRPDDMTDADAEWIIRAVWTGQMRRAFGEVPGHFLSCACEWGQSGHCSAGRHTTCQHNRSAPKSTPEAPCGLAALRADVWLVGRACAWRCSCGCHIGQTPASAVRVAGAEDNPEQLSLLDLS